MALPAAFRTHLATLGIDLRRALVAVSGGSDSVALLDLMATCPDLRGADLVVAHADHGIDPASPGVALGVEELARAYGLPCEVGRLSLGPAASETLARARRYQWLEQVRRRCAADYVVTAHHADDQAETVLMRVLKGSGPAGLAAMSCRRGRIVRPLLPFRRVELARHVQQRGLAVWDDPANENPAHLRSWLRTALLPMVRTTLPAVDANLGRVAVQAAVDRTAWDAVLDTLPDLDCRDEPGGISVAVAPLQGYASALALGVLSAAARRAGTTLGPKRASQVLQLALQGASGTSFPLGDAWQAERAFDRLRLVAIDGAAAATANVPVIAICGDAGDECWDGWQLAWRREAAPPAQRRDGMTAWFIPDRMYVRGWRAGDRIRPLAGRGSRPVVRCFQDARVPRSRRPAWPVFATGRGVLWVPGVCRSDDLLPAPGTEALRVAVAHT